MTSKKDKSVTDKVIPGKSKKGVAVSSPSAGEREKQLEEQLKKALADYHNLKKDMEKRLDFEGALVKRDILSTIVDLADDIDVAIDHVDDEKGWREGVAHILEKFRTVIDDLGAEIIECREGEKFDPLIHEAVGVVYGEKEGTVAKVVQNGYRFGEVIVRPARVIVYKISIKENGKDTRN